MVDFAPIRQPGDNAYQPSPAKRHRYQGTNADIQFTDRIVEGPWNRNIELDTGNRHQGIVGFAGFLRKILPSAFNILRKLLYKLDFFRQRACGQLC